MQRLLLFVTLISAAYTAAVPERGGRIVGGSLASIKMYPFMASMQSNWATGQAFGHTCGGSLITSTAVLSASHCFDLNPAPVLHRVRLGSASRYLGGVFLLVSRINFHPGFGRPLLTDDIAIIRLATPAPLSNNIQVARIAGPNYPLPDHLRVYIAGWGVTNVGDFEGSHELMHADVRIINHALCTKRYAEVKAQPGYEEFPDVTPAMFCSGILDVGGRDACQGDSGGPVVHGGDIVVGITSWGYGCAQPRYPGVNTRVPSHTQWIVENAVN